MKAVKWMWSLGLGIFLVAAAATAQDRRLPTGADRGPRDGGDMREAPPDGPRREFPRDRGPARRLAGVREYLEELKANAPDEFNRLLALRESDKVAFFQEIRKAMTAADGKGALRARPAEVAERRCLELSRDYRAAADPAAKERLMAELKEAISQAFDKRLEMQKGRLAHMEEEIERLRASLRQRADKRDDICRARLEQLTRDPSLDWDGGLGRGH